MIITSLYDFEVLRNIRKHVEHFATIPPDISGKERSQPIYLSLLSRAK